MFPLTVSKYRGCLLGAAIGDALGMGFAGLSREEIVSRNGGNEFAAGSGATSLIVPVGDLGESEAGEPLQPGQWTEDTQLMLALAATLIEEGGVFVPEAWSHSLVRWVNAEPRLPGISTLQAALQLRTGGVFWDEAADPEGAGCGPAARVAPIALLYAGDPVLRRRYAVMQAQVTHGHPDAHAAALAMAEAIALLLPTTPTASAERGGPFLLTTLAQTVASTDASYTTFARCLELAATLLEDGVDRATAVRVLGVSGWSREAVPCALYLLASAPADPEALLRDSVRLTGGATDSIAAMVGALTGALHGDDGLPERWRSKVEEAASIAELGSTLFRLSAA